MSSKGENELTVFSKFRHSGENRNPLVFNVFDRSSLEEDFGASGFSLGVFVCLWLVLPPP